MKKLIAMGLFLVFLSGCGVCPPVYEYMKSGVPQWIYKIPQKNGWVYAWGSGGYSLGKVASQKFALSNAKKTLAILLGARIFHESKGGALGQNAYTYIFPLTDWEKLDCEVVEEWFDTAGEAGLGYQSYVLIRTKRSK